jgi:hypothetical protein
LAQKELTKPQTTHCFPAIPDYIALQRVWCARSFWPGFLFGHHGPPQHDPKKVETVFRKVMLKQQMKS